MGKSNLRAAFALGLESSVAAQQVFTDRVEEVAAFDSALGGLVRGLDAADVPLVVDRRAPRWNVLVYFWVGGIGKTTLSQELERRLTAGEVGGEGPRAVVRMDFAEPAAFDLESYVLRLRAGLGRLGRRWPAFDLAFSVYWERAHPGESLEEFVVRDSALRRVARAVGLSEQITATVGDLVAGSLPGMATGAKRLAGVLYRHARDAVVRHRVLNRCELLPELLEADADADTLSYLPYLLGWDLERIGSPRPRVVVFLDTFEALTARRSREAERWVQRSVFLMPNVLFVVTGRNRLDWADTAGAGELDFTGAERWPGLHAGYVGADARQHLVGYLSPEDAEAYLAHVLVENGKPAIQGVIRERITAAGGGLPLYLDLAVTAYLDLLARGRRPAARDFGMPLGVVVARMLRDLDEHERCLLRAAALVEAFDLDLLRAGCPGVPDAALRRFRDRPFLEHDPDRVWPYALHATLRESIREADVDLRDSWSVRERTAAAVRMADHLGQVSARAAAAGDGAVEARVWWAGVGLARLTGECFDWLVDAAQRMLTSGNWDAPAAEAGGPDAVWALLTGFAGARERRAGSTQSSIDLLTAAVDRPGLPDHLRRFLLLHRGHALRVAGRYADAAVDYEVLASSPGGFHAEAVYWLADYAFLDGRFDEALAALDGLAQVPEHLPGEILRLRGHVHRVNALFAEAEGYYRHALALAREAGNLAAEGKALTDLIQTAAYPQPDEALGLVDRAREINSGIHNRVELVKIHAATAIAHTLTGNPKAAETEIRDGLTLTGDCHYPGGAVWCWTARALAALRADDRDGHIRAVARITDITDTIGGNRFWARITAWWGEPDTAPTGGDSTIRWIGGTLAARQRWRTVHPGTP